MLESSQNYVVLRKKLRVFTGRLRGIYGFPTPTGKTTGFLRVKTRFLTSWAHTMPKTPAQACRICQQLDIKSMEAAGTSGND